MTPTITKKQMIYSYSRLTMFNDCQRMFWHKYIEGRPYSSNTPMKIGKIFHSAISHVITEGYSPEEAVFMAIEEEGGLPEGERDFYLIAMVKRAYYRLQEFQSQ